MKLVILARQEYEDYFRKQLIEVAEQQGIPVLYVALLPQHNKIDLVRKSSVIASHHYKGSLTPVIRDIAGFSGTDELVVIQSSAYANAWKIMQLKLSLHKALFVFDVFDDFFYDASGLKLMAFKSLDFIYTQFCVATLVLSKGLLIRYPKAFHLENASHLSPIPYDESSIPARIVVIASFDHRLDGQWLQRLVLLMPQIQFDLYGWIHFNDKNIESELQSLIKTCANLNYLGSYQNPELANILAEYRIGLIPYYADHKLTRYINPDKIFHYLCAGMEVISTPIPQAIRMQQYLHICLTSEDAVQAINQLLIGRHHKKNPGDLFLEFNWTRRWNELKQFLEMLF